LVQEYDIQRLPAQCLTDASFGKLILFEVMWSKFPKVSGFKMNFFPQLM